MTEFKFFVEDRSAPSMTTQAKDKLSAFGEANEHFGTLPQGAWMETSKPNEFRWALGNFFD